MIIKLLNAFVFNLISLLTTAINIPSLPDGVQSVMVSVTEYVTLGLGILANWTHLSYLLSLLSVVVAVEVGVALYRLVMFVVAKIPMLGVK